MVERANNPYQPKELIPKPDAEVFERAKTDPGAFGQIFEYYFPRFGSYVHKELGNIDLESIVEMVDGVFVGFTKHLQRFRIEPGTPPAAYLWTSINHAISNYRRDRNRHPKTPFDEGKVALIADPKTPESVAVKQETRKEIHQAIGELTPLQQQVINLTHFAEMTAEETAQQLNTTVGAVKAALFRARQELREKLRELVETE